MRAALSYVTTEEQSASGRVCSLSPTELSWPPETSCFELFLSTSPDAGQTELGQGKLWILNLQQ